MFSYLDFFCGSMVIVLIWNIPHSERQMPSIQNWALEVTWKKIINGNSRNKYIKGPLLMFILYAWLPNNVDECSQSSWLSVWSVSGEKGLT